MLHCCSYGIILNICDRSLNRNRMRLFTSFAFLLAAAAGSIGLSLTRIAWKHDGQDRAGVALLITGIVVMTVPAISCCVWAVVLARRARRRQFPALVTERWWARGRRAAAVLPAGQVLSL